MKSHNKFNSNNKYKFHLNTVTIRNKQYLILLLICLMIKGIFNKNFPYKLMSIRLALCNFLIFCDNFIFVYIQSNKNI